MTGCGLLLLTAEATFERLAPWLIGFASLAILVRPRPRPLQAARPPRRPGDARRRLPRRDLRRLLRRRRGRDPAGPAAARHHEPLATSNALKNVLLGLANAVAALGFALLAPVEWLAIVPLAVGLFAGARLGPVVVRHAPAGALRLLIGLAGLALAVVLGADAY